MSNQLPLHEALGGDTEQARQGRGANSANWIESAFSAATGELVGGEARPEIEQYRQENPIGGTTSFIAGQLPYFATPFTRVGSQVARTVPGFARGMRTADKLSDAGRPVASAIARDTNRMAAFETGRIGATAAIQQEWDPTWGVMKEGAFNLGLTAAGAGLFSSLSRNLPPSERRAGTLRQAQEIDPSFDFADPPQRQMQTLSRISNRDDISDRFRSQLATRIARMGREVRQQNVPEGQQAIDRLSDLSGTTSRDWTRSLSRRFQTKDTPHLEQAKLIRGKKFGGMRDRERFDSIVKNRELLPENFEQHMGLPRYNRVKTRRAARQTDEMFRRSMGEPMLSNGRQTWLSREPGENGFVMAQRIRKGRGATEPGDEFLLFKTDRPGFFAEDLSRFGESQSRAVFQLAENSGIKALRQEAEITRFADELGQAIPDDYTLRGAEALAKTKPREAAQRLAERIVSRERLGEIQQNIKGSVNFADELYRRYLSPTITQATGRNGNPMAARALLYSKMLHDRMRAKTTQILAGTTKAGTDENIIATIWRPDRREGGVFNMIDDLPEEALRDVSRAWLRQLSPEEMAEEGLSTAAQNFMRRLKEIDQNQIAELNSMARALGQPEFQALENHYMLSHMWRGNKRLRLKDRSGNTMAMASGNNRKEILDEADRLKKVLDEDGITVDYNPREIRHAGEDENFTAIKSLFSDGRAQQNIQWMRRARDPQRFQERKDVRGFVGEDRPLTKQQLKEMVSKNVTETNNLMATRVAEHDLFPVMQTLKREDPMMFDLVKGRLRDQRGERSDFNRAVEEAVDNVLEPVLGQSAANIARSVNQAVFQLTLGFGNLGFAALNAVTFVQTALPEAAWLMHAPPARIADMYGSQIIQSGDRMYPVNFLEPMKIMRKGFQDLMNPDPQMARNFQRAREEGIAAPVLSEEVFGPNSDIARHFKSFTEGDRTMVGFMQELSAYLPARTEEMSRAMGFAMGHRIGRDFMRLEGENLYQFAARYVDNTHFRYTVADRPKILSGAFGTMFGLFKNWMMHYIANTTRYAGAGFQQANWGPLLWAQGGAMSVAGLGGSQMLPIADGLSKALTEDQKAVQTLNDLFGYRDEADALIGEDGTQRVLDGIYYGLPAMLNVGLQHRGSVPGADIVNDIEQLYSVALWDRAQAGGQTIGAALDAWQTTGRHPMRDEQTANALLRFAMPGTMQRSFQVTEDRALKSLRSNNTIISDITWTDAALNAVGFLPRDIGRAYSASEILYQEQADLQDTISNYGEAATQAKLDGDYRELNRIFQRAQREGLTPDRIQRSMDARINNRMQGTLDRAFDDEVAAPVRRQLGVD